MAAWRPMGAGWSLLAVRHPRDRRRLVPCLQPDPRPESRDARCVVITERMEKKLMRNLVFALAVSLSTGIAGAAPATQVKNIILVHGAFADGSSWAKVIPLLQ